MTERSTRVLAICGHPVIRGVVRLACDPISELELVGEVAVASEASGSVLGSRPDVVVLDLEMPDEDGLSVLRRLRADGFAGLVLVLTDRTDGATVLEALRLGVRGFLGKADGLRSVGPAIRRIAAGERVIGPEHEQVAVMQLGRFARQAREGSEVRASLTPREHEILLELSEGFTLHQIGRRLGISPRTVETHVAKLYRKLSVQTRVQAVARAASLGLIDLE